MRFAYSDVVERPPSDVFAFIADVDRKHEWVTEVLSSRLTSDGQIGPGTTFEDTVRFLGRTSVVPTVFTEYEPPRKIAYRHLGGPIQAELAFEMLPVPAGSDLSVTIEAQLPWYLRPLTPILRRELARQMDANFAALKSSLRSGASSPAGVSPHRDLEGPVKVT